MIRTVFFLILFILTGAGSFAQDVITKKNGEDIQAKVLEVSKDEVRYRKFDNPDGPVFILPVSDLIMIRYENGTKDLFNTEANVPADDYAEPAEDMFMKGQKDATRYYKGYKAAGTGTLILSLLSPLVGLIPAVGCSATTPKPVNLGYPSQKLFNHPDYKNGYTVRAKRIKSGKVWTNWGIAFGVNLILVLAMSQ